MDALVMDVDKSPLCSRATTSIRSINKKPMNLISPSDIDIDSGSSEVSNDSDHGNSSDQGQQGDDELSDWCFAYNSDRGSGVDDEFMGIPSVKQQLVLGGGKVLQMESSDTDISQCSTSHASKRLMSKSGGSMCGALKRRIVQFLRNDAESELYLGELRKKERKEALRLAMFYNLDVRREVGCRSHVLLKTPYSRWMDC